MGSSKFQKQKDKLFKEASKLASDGRFSKSDYESISDRFGKVKGWAVGQKKSDLTRYIARALHENDAVLDSDAQKLANKYSEGGLSQTRGPGGQLRTSFKQATGGRRDLSYVLGSTSGEFYDDEFVNAPISDIEKKSWTQHTPAGASTSKWDVYTRTYTHAPKAKEIAEPEVVEAPAAPEPVREPSQELADTRSQWDQSEGQGSIGYDPTAGRAPGVVGGVGAAADYGNRATDDYHERFIPHLNVTANLQSQEMGHAGGKHLDRFEGKVPQLASSNIKDVYGYYSDKITKGK